MLLAMVLGVVLVLIGVTASALVWITSVHLTSATLTSVVGRDASLVSLFVNANMRASDLDPDELTERRVTELGAALDALSERDSIVRVEIRSLDGRVLVSDHSDSVGLETATSAGMAEALDGRPQAVLLDDPALAEAAGGLSLESAVVQEFFPILNAEEEPLAVVALWRDAEALVTGMSDAQRDVMLITLVAGALLAALLFLVFRASQARLTRQHRQLMDATRRDALTGMLNHGAVVGRLSEEIETARTSETRIGLALVDVDNFRLFNTTHGHDAGDHVLLRVAEVVNREGEDAVVARYGPDEFLVVSPDRGVTEMEQLAQRLRLGLEDVGVVFDGTEVLPVSVSVGICAYPDHAAASTELLSAATVALAEAKASGGDSVRTAQTGEEERVVAGSFDVLQGLVLAVDTKDRYTKRHSEDVARYAVFLAQRLGLDEDTQRTIQLAGLLHDVGKIGIPDPVLRKPSKLTDDEFRMFNQHVVLGAAIVGSVPNAQLVQAGIRHHHERWDGTGYVDGLAGEMIPLVARIISVADTFSAMTTTRPYRKALPLSEAISRLRDAAGTQLQPELVVEFITGIETDADAPMPGEEPTQLWRPELWVA
jgi:diguanylate cyclase (GGDEF)-like protein/putative nucleotidyltransferase with HDIG domain